MSQILPKWNIPFNCIPWTFCNLTSTTWDFFFREGHTDSLVLGTVQLSQFFGRLCPFIRAWIFSSLTRVRNALVRPLAKSELISGPKLSYPVKNPSNSLRMSFYSQLSTVGQSLMKLSNASGSVASVRISTDVSSKPWVVLVSLMSSIQSDWSEVALNFAS